MPRYIDNNTANYIDCGDPPTFGSWLTAVCWVKFFDVTNAPKIFCKWGVGTNTHEWLMTLDGSNQFSVWTMTSGTANYTNATGPVAKTNRWYHMAMRQDSSDLRVYVDGVLGTGTGTPVRTLNDTSNRVLIGRGEDGAPLNGYVAHCAFWNMYLPDSAIWQLARGEIFPNEVHTQWLKGYWKGDGYPSENNWAGPVSQNGAMQGAVRGGIENDVPLLNRPHPEAPIEQQLKPPLFQGLYSSRPVKRQ